MEYEVGGTEAMPRKGLTWIKLSIYMNPSVRWGNGGPQREIPRWSVAGRARTQLSCLPFSTGSASEATAGKAGGGGGE